MVLHFFRYFFMRFFLFLALLCSVLTATAAPASPESSDAWQEAMTAYKAADFQRALQGFKKIAEDEKQVSAALCHNIANCEYKLGHAAGSSGSTAEGLTHEAAASIWYRRALALDPWLPEAQQNLRFLHNKLGFHQFQTSALRKYAEYLPRRQWLAICQGAIWVAVIVIVWLVWATPKRGRRWPLVVLLCLSVLVIANSVTALTLKATDEFVLAKRIVSIQPENAFARSAPAEAAGTVIALPPGSELFPLRKEGYWIYCQVPGGDKEDPIRGWVRDNTTELLWPWKASLVE
jgi:hypothetical protein